MNKIFIWFRSSLLGNQYLPLRMTTPKTGVFGQLRRHILRICAKIILGYHMPLKQCLIDLIKQFSKLKDQRTKIGKPENRRWSNLMISPKFFILQIFLSFHGPLLVLHKRCSDAWLLSTNTQFGHSETTRKFLLVVFRVLTLAILVTWSQLKSKKNLS